MSKDVPLSLPIDTADYETLGHVAKLLGKSKAFVKKAIDRGLIRGSSEPFKSNLNGGQNGTMILVNLQDVRDVLTGKIDLAVLESPRNVTRKSLPSDMTEMAEMVVNVTQTVEQLAVMVSTVLELLQTGYAPKPPPKKREVPSEMV